MTRINKQMSVRGENSQLFPWVQNCKVCSNFLLDWLNAHDYQIFVPMKDALWLRDDIRSGSAKYYVIAKANTNISPNLVPTC